MTVFTLTPELLEARRLAHEAFDPIWKRLMEREGKTFKQAKGIAYTWLQRNMGLTPSQCHMTVMSEEQCKKVIALCKSRRVR